MIRIENPCSADFSEMTIVEGGRFCDSCKRKVHDFSNATVEEIRKQYELSNGKLCGHVSGRLLLEQFKIETIRKGYFYNLKIFCWAVILSFGSSLFNIPSAHANGLISRMRSGILRMEKDTNSVSAVSLKGILKDTINNEAVPFADITLSAGDVMISKAITNMDGSYELKIDTAKYRTVDLVISLIGYQPAKIKSISIPDNMILNIEIPLYPMMMRGEMTMTVQEVLIPMSEPLIKGKKHRKAKKSE